MTAGRSTLILTVDGLGSRDLGSYGNTWIETPAVDRLAARSHLFETVLIDDADPNIGMNRMVRGPGDRPWGLPLLRQAGLRTVLVTDASDVFSADLVEAGFDERITMEPCAAVRSAETWEQTHCAEFFAQLLDVRRSIPHPHLLWAHYGGLTQCWDAPFAWRQRLVEEDDPQPTQGVQPVRGAAASMDPDEQLQAYQAWGAEVQVLNACFDPFLDEWFESPGTLILTSPRGYPIGEHGVMGFESPILYSELSSVPFLICPPEQPIGWRSRALIQPSHISNWLSEWGQTARAGGQGAPADFSAADGRHAVARSSRGAVLRSEAWMLVQSKDSNELYAKPDDRWEFNDVSSRCSDIVEQLAIDLQAALQSSLHAR